MRDPWEFRDQVALGMKELERARPGSTALIDPEHLRLSHDCHCPLGQIYGFYAYGIMALGGPAPSNDPECVAWAAERGFHTGTLLSSRTDPEWRSLTEAWRQALTGKDIDHDRGHDLGGCSPRRAGDMGGSRRGPGLSDDAGSAPMRRNLADGVLFGVTVILIVVFVILLTHGPK